jgi:Nucleotide-diphospho-sugar transferase
MVSQLMAWGYDVLSTDPDVAFLRNPLPYMSALVLNHPAVDVFSTSDSNNGVYIHPGGGGSNGGVPSPDGQSFHSVTRVTWNNTLGALQPRWAASFPQLAVPSGYVYRSELRSPGTPSTTSSSPSAPAPSTSAWKARATASRTSTTAGACTGGPPPGRGGSSPNG